jgi:hypothetical protein
MVRKLEKTIRYKHNDQVKEHELGRYVGTLGRKRNYIGFHCEKPEGKGHLGRSRRSGKRKLRRILEK